MFDAESYVVAFLSHMHRRIQGGLGGTCPPLDRLKRVFLRVIFWLAYVFCSGRLLKTTRKISATTPPPPTQSRPGLWRPRGKFLLLPPPQSVVVPLLDYPLWIRPCDMARLSSSSPSAVQASIFVIQYIPSCAESSSLFDRPL